MTPLWVSVALVVLRLGLVLIITCKLFGYSIENKATWGIVTGMILTDVLGSVVEGFGLL